MEPKVKHNMFTYFEIVRLYQPQLVGLHAYQILGRGVL